MIIVAAAASLGRAYLWNGLTGESIGSDFAVPGGAVLAMVRPPPKMRPWPDLPPMASVALTPELLGAQDAVVLVTDHRAVDYQA